MEDGDVREVLQTTLASCQNLSPKLAGLIRRFKAVTTLLLMRRDSAFSDLDKYTNALKCWVNDFDEKMRSAIQFAFSEKAAIIKAYKEEVEEELSTLGVLLRESEKLLLMSSNFNATQIKHGKTLVTALKMMKTTGLLETRDVDENLSCLKLSTQLDCENLPSLGQLITNYSPDKIKPNEMDANPPTTSSTMEEVKSSENKSMKEKSTVKSTSTQTDIIITEKERNVESKTSKSKRGRSCQRLSGQKSFLVQENQRFIISQLEKGGISKQRTRSTSVSSVDSETIASVDGNVKEDRPRRRPVVRSSSLKLDNNQSPQKLVSKKENSLRNITKNYSKDEGSPVRGTSVTKNSNMEENGNDYVQGNEHLKGNEGSLEPIAISSLPHLCKEVENLKISSDGSRSNDKSTEKEVNTYTSSVSTVLDPSMSKEEKTGKPTMFSKDSFQIQAPVTNASQVVCSSKRDEVNQNVTESRSYSNQQKSDLTSPKVNDTQKLGLAKQTPRDEKEFFSSQSMASMPVSTENNPVKLEPITPIEVKIKQEPVTPPDLNNNRSVFNVQQRIPVPLVKKSSSLSEVDTWENYEEIAEKNSLEQNVRSDRIQQENLTEKISPEKDVNYNVLDKESVPSPSMPSPSLLLTTGALLSNTGALPSSQTGVPPPSETGAPSLRPSGLNSTEKLESNNNEVPMSSTSNKDLVNGNQNFLTDGLGNKLVCNVSDIPLPKTPEVQKKISTVNVHSKNYTDSVITQHIREELSQGKRGYFSPISARLLFKCGTENNMKYPIGVATNSIGEIYVADTGNNIIRVYNDEGKQMRVMGKGLNMRRPSAIVVNSRDEVFVKDDAAVFAFTAQGNFIKVLTVQTLGYPYGLDLTPDGQLVTLDVQRIKPRVIILASNGSFKNSFPFAPLLHPQTPTSSKCRFLAIYKERLIVSDLGCNCVYITDNFGDTLFKFGEYGMHYGQFKEPSGVTTDQQGHMLIGDSKNDRIQVFKPNGSFLCDIKFDQAIRRPSDIHLTKDGKLYVTNFLHHQVFVYQLGGK